VIDGAKPRDAWGDFWASQADQGGGGCLSARWKVIDDAQRTAWREFARRLPPKAKLLDLATGDGRVMGWLLEARRDLKPLGVDLASSLPRPPKGARSRGGVAMEALPFPDHSHDAIVSQFGFEYGDTGKVLGEIARVVRPGGAVGLMTHRLDGPILEHNVPRREGLAWAIHEQDLIAKARGSLAVRAMGFGPPPAVMAAPAEARRRFGEGSAGWELAEAIARTLTLGRNDRPEEVGRLLDRLDEMAANEIGRIDSLEQACRRVADQPALEQAFQQAGLALEDHELVRERGTGRPFADFWALRRN
jgi:SAM-dependent methyltransferase